MLKIVNPYPGFENGFYRPYLEDEDNLFFGREKDISTLKLKIRQRKLISIIGEPKMGKTSLIRAGLIPNLRQKPFDGYNGSSWRCVFMMPDTNPVLALAKAIVNPVNKISDKIIPSMEEEVYQQLMKNDYGLVRVIERIIGDREINILIAIDDMIDVFDMDVDPRQRHKFFRLIYRAYSEKLLPLFFVTAFDRDDFKSPKLREDPKFHKALNMGMHKLKFLDNNGLSLAINAPSKLVKSVVADDLGKELMLMLLQDSDQLRKLQLLMSRTWLEWKRNHKDKTITKAHYFRATGQKSKAVARGLKKSGSKSVDSLLNAAEGGDSLAMAKTDYANLSEYNKSLFKRIIPHLINDNGRKLKAVNVDRKKAIDILAITMDQLGELVMQIPTILAMDRKKLSINDASLFDEWDDIKKWIKNSNILKVKFIQLADAAISHYIDGVEMRSVLSKAQYKAMFATIDVDMITESWARAQHEQYELGLDFIDKLIETYGPVEYKASDGTRKKMSLKKKVKRDLKINVKSSGSEADDDARKEALAILGISDSSDNSGGQAPKNDVQKEQVSEMEPALDEEDEAIKRLLEGEGDDESGQQEEAPKPKRVIKTKIKAKKKEEISAPPEEPAPKKPKVSIKPKAKIVLGSKPKEKTESAPPKAKIVKKPKIVIKKK